MVNKKQTKKANIDSTSIYESKVKNRRKTIQSFEVKFLKNRSLMSRLVDKIVDFSGTVTFFCINLIWFFSWIIINLGLLPFVKPFDPYPFGFLTMVVSLEAIFLSIFVLISQKKQSKIADLREEIGFQVNMIAEAEITKIMHMISGLYTSLNLKVKEDSELNKMLKPLDPDEIERKIEKQIDMVYK